MRKRQPAGSKHIREARTPFSDLTFQQQVTRALVPARAMVLGGVETQLSGNDTDTEITIRITKLLGTDVCQLVPDGKAFDELDNALIAALALGAAIGLLLRPEAFGIGGAR